MFLIAWAATLVVFVCAVVSKVRDGPSWASWVDSFKSWGLPRRWRPAAGTVVVALEVTAIAALAMAFTGTRGLALWPALILMVGFTVGLGVRRRQTAAPCHCFGAASAGVDPLLHIVMNLALIAVLIVGMQDAWVTRTAGDVVFAAGTGVVLGLVLVFAPLVVGPPYKLDKNPG